MKLASDITRSADTKAMKPRRRFRFRLSTLFWLILVVALLMLAMNERRKRIQLEAEIKRQSIEVRYLAASLKVSEKSNELFAERLREIHGYPKRTGQAMP